MAPGPELLLSVELAAALAGDDGFWRGQGLSGDVDWWRSLRRGDVHRECLARDGSPPDPFHSSP